MIDLAMGYGEKPQSIAALAKGQGISDAYLEQLIGVLRKAGLVESKRGARGGYELARPPEGISVGEVLTALEGSTAVMRCVSDELVDCDNACVCSTRPLWLKLQISINDVLKSTTLEDMAEDYKTQKRRMTNEEDIS